MREKVGQRHKDWNVLQANGPFFASLTASQEHGEPKRPEIIFLPSVDFGISFCLAHFRIPVSQPFLLNPPHRQEVSPQPYLILNL